MDKEKSKGLVGIPAASSVLDLGGFAMAVLFYKSQDEKRSDAYYHWIPLGLWWDFFLWFRDHFQNVFAGHQFGEELVLSFGELRLKDFWFGVEVLKLHLEKKGKIWRFVKRNLIVHF